MEQERGKESESPQDKKKTFMARYTIHGTPFEIEMPEGSRVEDLIKEIVKKHGGINFSEYKIIHFDAECISWSDDCLCALA